MTLVDRVAMSSTQQPNNTARPAAELQTVAPVSVFQLKDAVENTKDDVYRVNDAPLVQVTVVGKASKIELTAGLLQFELDDTTGVISVKQYYDKESADALYTPKDGEYVRVYGMLRSLSDGVAIIGLRVAGLRNPNELSYHILEVITAHCHHKKGPLPSLVPPPSQSAPSPNAAGTYYPGYNSPTRSTQHPQSQPQNLQSKFEAEQQQTRNQNSERAVEAEIVRVCEEFKSRNSFPTKDDFTSNIKQPAPVIIKALNEMRIEGRLFTVKKDQFGLAA